MARILVIEDNPANLELMAYLLRAFGHTPLVARDGEEGVSVVREEMPDLIICDVQIPKFDGYEVARQLKSHPALQKIPLVAVTAFAMVGDRDKVLAAGFDGYLPKPITPETFVGQVEAFLRPEQSAAPPPAPPAAPAPAPSLAKRAIILVVDNSPVNLNLMRSTLEPFGYEVITAASAREALAVMQRHAPDLILSDVHMPEQSGYDLIQVVKADQQLSAIPFAFISSTVWQPELDRARGSALGAVKFIMRPIEPQALLAEIEGCLNKGGGSRGDDPDRR